jgi:hypothetical protein
MFISLHKGMIPSIPAGILVEKKLPTPNSTDIISSSFCGISHPPKSYRYKLLFSLPFSRLTTNYSTL